MKKLLAVVIAGLFLSVSAMVARAQSGAKSDEKETPHYEVGGQLFAFNGRELGVGWGAGGRFTYNINEYVALDNEIDFFLPDEGPPVATEGLFGLKVGKRIDNGGVFVKARPGFQTNFLINGRERSVFALDVGVVAEYYPNRHIVLRFDAGDVIIPINGTLGQGISAQHAGTTHNFQGSMGIGVRW